MIKSKNYIGGVITKLYRDFQIQLIEGRTLSINEINTKNLLNLISIKYLINSHQIR